MAFPAYVLLFGHADDTSGDVQGNFERSSARPISSADEQNSSDAALLARIAVDDERAFADIWERYHRRLAAYVYRQSHSTDVVDEILQQVFVTLWEERQRVTTRPSLAAFLFTVARNRLSHYRDRERVAHAHLVHAATDTDGRVTYNFGEAAVEVEELARRIERAIEQLPPRTGEIIRLRRDDGLAPGEIATVLGIAPQVVYNQLSRAVKALAEAIGFTG